MMGSQHVSNICMYVRRLNCKINAVAVWSKAVWVCAFLTFTGSIKYVITPRSPLPQALSCWLLVILPGPRCAVGFIIAETFIIRVKSEVLTVVGNYERSVGGSKKAPLCPLSPYDWVIALVRKYQNYRVIWNRSVRVVKLAHTKQRRRRRRGDQD